MNHVQWYQRCSLAFLLLLHNEINFFCISNIGSACMNSQWNFNIFCWWKYLFCRFKRFEAYKNNVSRNFLFLHTVGINKLTFQFGFWQMKTKSMTEESNVVIKLTKSYKKEKYKKKKNYYTGEHASILNTNETFMPNL